MHIVVSLILTEKTWLMFFLQSHRFLALHITKLCIALICTDINRTYVGLRIYRVASRTSTIPVSIRSVLLICTDDLDPPRTPWDIGQMINKGKQLYIDDFLLWRSPYAIHMNKYSSIIICTGVLVSSRILTNIGHRIYKRNQCYIDRF